ncbi:MAG: glycoside hydrolase family 16 protein [Clostridia bacterium]|nr:glycoside hydrolase family 16 protein [Clostridia bacterium]
MKKNRLISLCLCIFLLVCSIGCGGETAKILSEDDIIGDDGCFIYTIVSAEGNSSISGADTEAKNLKKQIAETFDIKVNDGIDKKIKAKSDTYEILLGNTNRAESKKALNTLKEKRIQNADDWMIKVFDKKICVVSVSDDNLPKAIRYFIVHYCTKLSDFSKLDGDFEYVDAKTYEVEDVSKVKIGENKISEFKIITSKEKSYLFTKKVNEFVNIFKEKYGIKLEKAIDKDTEEGKYEIIIGDTNRDLSSSNKPTGENYIIALIDTKLVINGGSDVAIAAGVQKLLDLEREAREARKPFSIEKGFKEEAAVKVTDDLYQLGWSDEFNGSLNKTVWTDPIEGEKKSPSPNGGTTYQKGIQNAFTRDGNLILTGKRLNNVDFESTAIVSTNAFAFRYGVLEIRAKLAPPPLTTCLWGYGPTFQIENGKRTTSPIKNKMEIDILENFGQKEWFASNVHQWWTDGSEHTSLDGTKFAEQKKYVYPEGEAFYNDYHIFSWEWTPYEMVFSVDGEAYFTYDLVTADDYGFMQTPVDLRFSAGYASSTYHLTKKYEDDVPKSAECLIDYVRIYQNKQYDSLLWLSPINK